jgi:rod shape-determining protein MreD
LSFLPRSSPPSERYAGPRLRFAIAWLLVALIVQATAMHFATVDGAEPSLVLVLVVWFAMRAGTRRAMLFGFLAGIGEDVLAFDSSGSWTIATTVTAFVASLPTRRFFEDSIPLFTIVTFMATLVRALIFWDAKSIEGYPAGLATIHFHKALESGVLNAVLAIAVAMALRHFEYRRSLAASPK